MTDSGDQGIPTSGTTIRGLILDAVERAEGPIRTAEIMRQVRLVRGSDEVGENSIRSEIAVMASSGLGLILRVSKGLYIKAQSHPREWEQEQVTNALHRLVVSIENDEIDRQELRDSYEPMFHMSAAVALIDTVFSSHGHRRAVNRVIDRVMSVTGRRNAEDFTISALLDQLDEIAPASMTAVERAEALSDFFGDGSKLARTAQLKGELVIDLGKRLLGRDGRPIGVRLNSRSDFLVVCENPLPVRIELIELIERELTDRSTGVAGVGRLMVRRLFVLMGANIVLPDQAIIRWVQSALGEAVARPSAARAAELVEVAAQNLQDESGWPTIRAVDELIWRAQRGSLASTSGIMAAKSGLEIESQSPGRQLDVGDEVDRIPRMRGRWTGERWHGSIVRILGTRMAEVRWTETDTLRDFRSNTRIPLRHRESGELIPFVERVKIDELALCDRGGGATLHPESDGTFSIGMAVWHGLHQPGRATWRGEVVGYVNGSRERVIVRWDKLIFPSDESVISEDDLHSALPIVRTELIKNLDLNPYRGLFGAASEQPASTDDSG